MEPIVRVTEYAVSCLPDDNVNRKYYTLTVKRQRDGRWAIMDGPFAYDVNGVADIEPRSWAFDEAWESAHLFDEATALELAKKFAPLMEVNGVTATGERVKKAE